MKRKALALTVIWALLVSAVAVAVLVNLTGKNSTSLRVSAQSIEPEVIHKQITIMPDGSFVMDYLCDNGTYVYDTHPDVPISRSIFGDYYTFTGDVYGRLVIEKDNIVVDGAGYKLQVQGAGGFAISAGSRDINRNPEFVGTNNLVITNMEIVEFGYGIELAGTNNIISKVNLTEGHSGGKAIWDSGSKNVIRDCRIFANDGSGIYVAGSGAIITGNYIADNSGVGIEFPSSAGELRNNVLLNNRRAFDFDTFPSTSNIIDASNTVDGKPVCCWINEQDKTVPADAGYVVLYNCTKITVENLQVYNNSASASYNSNGISLFSTTNSIVKNNQLPVGAGISIVSSQTILVTGNYVGSGGVTLTSTRNSTVTNNTVTAEGIKLSGSADIRVSENMITKCVAGIIVSTSSSNRIIKNQISDCNVGISVFSSNDNSFSQNNLISNQKHVSEQHYALQWPLDQYYESVNNEWDGNYWRGYNGTDQNRDGVGDTPYVIDDNNQDNYPLMNPFSTPSTPRLIENPSTPTPTPDDTNTTTENTELSLILLAAIVVAAIAVVTVSSLRYIKKRRCK